ncbi:MAG: prepilin-type N-terminal cleavage/methylation domain-containing protein, partial [Bacilli bacterium]
MKKNKGFTLIELLAVIVVLAIILVIAIININGYIKKAKEQANIITV